MNSILRTHVIDAALLRTDSFEAFYVARKASLLGLIEKAMGKASSEGTESVSEDEDDEDGERENSN